MSTTVPEMPRSANQETLQITPATTALAQTNDATISSSTEITLNSSTALIEVTAKTNGIYMKWGTDDVTSSNFDEYILGNTTRHYAVPSGETAVNFIEEAASATLIVIEK